MYHETIKLSGHIIDSQLLPKVLDQLVDLGIEFDIQKLNLGKKNTDKSESIIKLSSKNAVTLKSGLKRIQQLGAEILDYQNAAFKKVVKDGVFPEDFYVTTNLETQVRHNNKWHTVENSEMDCGIVRKKGSSRFQALSIGAVVKGDEVVVGRQGIRVLPLKSENKKQVFEFMASTVSSEKPKKLLIETIAQKIRQTKQDKKKILVVAGPAVVHTGGRDYLVKLINAGYVDVIFAGNALAVHDIEFSLFGTSLGVCLRKGIVTATGHENHLRAINKIRAVGSIINAVKKGVLKSGIMYSCIKKNVKYVLAASIRDDGPLPEVITDTLEVQNIMRKNLKDVDMVLMLSTMLHSIATGNMLPADTKTVCVDINPAVVTKLVDRGSFQATGVVTDVEAFLRELCHCLGL